MTLVAILLVIASANGIHVPWICWLFWCLAGTVKLIGGLLDIIKD